MQTPQKEVIVPAGGAKPLAPYSPGIRAGQFVYTSGQIGLDSATGKLAPGGVQAEAKQALENLKAVLEAAGASLESVVKTTVFMQDIGDYAAINEIYGGYFSADPPARSAVQVAALPAGALVEVEAVALVNAA